MTCPHCKCATYMNPCPQCGENTNRPNYAGYSPAVRRRQAIESLERWAAQLADLIESGCFGEHQTENCTACRASRLMDGIDDLRRVMERPACLPSAKITGPGEDHAKH